MDFERIKSYLRPAGGKTLLIGFSGGADSTSLLLLAKRYQSELTYQLEAVHFEHGIRGSESREDAVWCENFCRRHEIKFRRIDLSVPMRKLPGENLEGAARRMRLEHFRKLSMQYQQSAVIGLGHHFDDRVETFFMRMSRGSNLSALLAPRPLAEIEKLTIIRPLIDCSRQEIEQFLTSENISDYRIDSTNHSLDYQRNFLRNKLLPDLYAKLNNSRNGIIRTLEVLNQDVDFIERAAGEEFAVISGKTVTDLSFWRRLHEALRFRVLRRHLAEINGCDSPLDGALIKRFNLELATPLSGTKIIPVNGRIQIELRNNECRVIPVADPKGLNAVYPAAAVTPPLLSFRKRRRNFSEISDREQAFGVWRWEHEVLFWGDYQYRSRILLTPAEIIADNSGETAYFDADRLPGDLLATFRHAGDRMQLFGEDCPRRVKNLLINEKLSFEQLENLVFFRLPRSQEIIWIPGVRQAEFARVTPQTGKIVQFYRIAMHK